MVGSQARPRHGGNLAHLAREAGLSAESILDFSANINPLGPPDWLRSLISSRVDQLVHYPDPDSTALVEAIAAQHGVTPAEVVVGNGSSELIYLLPRVLGATRALVSVPAYCDYARACEVAGVPVEAHVLREEQGFELDLDALPVQPGDMVFLGQPNNPTGLCLDPERVRDLAGRHEGAHFVVDEAFADFVEGLDRLTRRRPLNLIVLCSMTKFFAMPGLRLGFAVGASEPMAALRRQVPCWSVNTLAQAVGEAALADEDYARRTREFVTAQRGRLMQELQSLPGLHPYPGSANFLLVRTERPAGDLARRVLEDGIAIRVCDNFEGLDDRFFRVAVRTEAENDRLCRSLRRALGVPTGSPKRRTPALMMLGTSSNAGKSVLAAALCRILLQDGYRVAPFKSQNMSLNSFVTRDGGEMGRAQVVQAQACRLDPDVRMNPILLKPNSHTGSQIIVMGKPVGNMEVEEYIAYKPRAVKTAHEAYDSLASEFDVLVLEGAGSPAEVNLKSHDIVNTAMARYAEAKALLIGDIDRGGVFASFVGTMELLAGWERDLVAGFIVNRFRGRKELLDDALSYTLRHTGRPVLGVVPYLAELNLPEEDSVEFKARRNGQRLSPDSVEVAVIDLPHISNFTDFDALALEPDVHLRIVRSLGDLEHPDAVVIPGSKNVIGDLSHLVDNGLSQKILDLAGSGTEVVGICGGFQMLGETVSDPHCLESDGSTLQGLALLPVATELASQKTLKRVEAKHVESGHPVVGYEIHHGLTEGTGLQITVVRDDGAAIGVGRGRVWGTYLHGLFDADGFRRWFLDRLRTRRGLEPVGKVCVRYDLEPAFERLAAEVREALDMNQIRRLVGLE